MDTQQPICQTLDGQTAHPNTAIFPIFKEIGDGKNRLVGTGFFITRIGHFVTAKHVIKDVYDFETGTQRATIHALHFVKPFEVLVRHITHICANNNSDLVVGKMDYHVLNETKEPLCNPVPIFTTEVPRVDSPVCTYAYPASDTIFFKNSESKFKPTYYSGKFVENSEGPRDAGSGNWPHMITTINTEPKASGGPVFDEKGRVIGVNSLGGIKDYSCIPRSKELLPLTVPEFPGDKKYTVHELAREGIIIFDPKV